MQTLFCLYVLLYHIQMYVSVGKKGLNIL